MRPAKPKQNTITLYSSAIAVALAGITTQLTVLSADPQQADVEVLASIQAQLLELSSQLERNESDMKTMGWIYPGPPACAAPREAAAMSLAVIKPEYFAVRAGGELEFMTEATYGCNGYSAVNVREIKTMAPEQFVTVSSSYGPDMGNFLRVDEATGQHTARLVEFVLEHEFTGVEIDFEGMGGWSGGQYQQYLDFIERLATALHLHGKELMVDVPPVSNTTEEQWYDLRLAHLEVRGVDQIVVMGYDYQYDHGPGEPVTPLDWLRRVIAFTKARVQDDSKIVIGLPTYGYVGNRASGRIDILTADQARAHPLMSGVVRRDARSRELIVEGDREVLVFQDEVSIQAKLAVVRAAGIEAVSFWHLGGNPVPGR